MGVMRVLHVAPEAYPLAKVGGLADVVGALPKALGPLGVEAHVLLPWHGGLEARRVGEVAFAFFGREERGESVGKLERIDRCRRSTLGNGNLTNLSKDRGG